MIPYLDVVSGTDQDVTRDCEACEKISGRDHHLMRFIIHFECQLSDNSGPILNNSNAHFNQISLLISISTWDEPEVSSVYSIRFAQQEIINVLKLKIKWCYGVRKIKKNCSSDLLWMIMEIKRAIVVFLKQRNYKAMKMAAKSVPTSNIFKASGPAGL